MLESSVNQTLCTKEAILSSAICAIKYKIHGFKMYPHLLALKPGHDVNHVI